MSRLLPRLAPLALAIPLALGSTSLWAQSPSAPAAAGAARQIDIPAQPLGDALNAWARQTRTQIAVQQTLVAGKHAPAVSGNLTPRQALDRLLAGSGLVAEVRGNEVIVRQVPSPSSSGERTLGAVTVVSGALNDAPTEGSRSFTTHAPITAATGMGVKLRDTPQSVSIITSERLSLQNLSGMADVMNQTTGLAMDYAEGTQIGAINRVYSRGYQVRNYRVDGVQGTLNVDSRDGISGIDSAVYDSVAVVRGATGLLVGAGDPSGSVSLTRKRPTRDFQGSLEAGYGSWGKHRVVADFSGALNATGSLRGRAVAAYQDDSYWVKAYEGDRTVLYGILEADIGSQTVLTAALQHNHAKANDVEGSSRHQLFFRGTKERTPFGRHDSLINGLGNFNEKQTSINLALDHYFNDDWQAKLSYTHGRSKLDQTRSYTFSPMRDDTGRIVFGAGEDIVQNNKTDFNALDARLSGKYTLGGRQHELVAGFNMNHQDTEEICDGHAEYWDNAPPYVGWLDGNGQFIRRDLGLMINCPTSELRSTSKTKQSGFFVATRLRATDHLSAIAGGRWSSWRYDSKPGANTWSYSEDHRRYNNEFIPYAGLTYDLGKNVTAYASYTEIFRPQYSKDVNGKLLDPEQGKNYELGLKGEWYEGRLNASIAVFRSGKDNLAVVDYAPDGEPRRNPDGDVAYVAKDDTKAEGWEMEVSGQLTSGWQMQAGYSYSTLKDSNGELIKNYVPNRQLKVFSTYIPKSMPKLTLGAGVNWRNAMTEDSNFRLGSYSVVDVMAQYAFTDHLSLKVNLNNVFDKDYKLGTWYLAYGPRRNAYASLNYKF